VRVTTAPADGRLHPLLAERRSTRAFDPRHHIDDTTLASLLEAARWAPSWANSQPWRLVVARRGEPAFDRLAATLVERNRVWAANAGALILAAASVTDASGRPLSHAWYDTGQAVAHLVLQAEAAGLASRQIGGFDPDAAARAFDLPQGVVPIVVVAVGRRDADAVLPEPVAAKERAPRTRRSLDEITLPAA
jgi:nitroreductase